MSAIDRFNQLFTTKTGGPLLPPPRRLHIGGRVQAAGWENFNLASEPTAQHVGDAKDLSRFADKTFQVVYASHVLEHFDYLAEARAVLVEWHRVLQPGGLLALSVPDLDVIARLMTDAKSFDDKYMLMRVIFGAHVDIGDHHRSGWTPEIISTYLLSAGFSNIRRVPAFGLFSDTSAACFNGTPLSLNVLADRD